MPWHPGVKRWAIVLWMAATTLGALAFPAASAVTATVPAHVIVKAAYNRTLKKTIIVDSRGFTLYMYSSDSPGQSGVLQRSDLPTVRKCGRRC
jgi:predicted lipoprotein with Yx(FWY)xxD motif